MSEEQGKPDIDSLLRNAQPRWITDGAGIRGNPVPTPPPSTGWDPSRSSGMSPVDPPVADYSGGVSTSNPASSPVSVTQTAPTAFPFQCTLVPQTHPDGSPAGNKVRVELNSNLFGAIAPWSYGGAYIEGLFDPNPDSSGYPVEFDLEGPDNTSGYISPGGVPDDHVFLEISGVWTPSTSVSATIDTKGNGNTCDPSLPPWDPSGNALLVCDSSTPPIQTKSRVVLATYIDGSLQQIVTSNLVLVDCVVSGQLAQYPYRFP